MTFVDPNLKIFCPFCFEEFHPGLCRIVSGIYKDINGDPVILHPEPQGRAKLQARFRTKKLVGTYYTLQDARRACPACQAVLPPAIEWAENHVIAVVGGVNAGKSIYITMLIDQLNRSNVRTPMGATLFQALSPEVEAYYKKEYYTPIITNKRMLSPTQPAVKLNDKPLMYHMDFSNAADGGMSRPVNLILYDAAGEDYKNPTALRLFQQHVLHADAVIYLADPLAMPKVKEKVKSIVHPDFLTHERPPTTEVLITVTTLLEQAHGKLLKMPVAITASKSDLLEYARTRAYYNYTFATPHVFGDRIHVEDFQDVDKEVRDLLGEYGETSLLNLSERYHTVRFFAVSATGNQADPDTGEFPAIEPRRCLDPLLWIMSELGIINAG